MPASDPCDRTDQTADIVSPKTRSKMMRAVGREGTQAEKIVRGILTHFGVRYSLNNRALPGSPDISNQSKGWAIFVNGCFWHGHRNCSRLGSGRKERIPVSNRGYWSEKLQKNRERDARKIRQLRDRGLKVLLVWECELERPVKLRERIRNFLDLEDAEGSPR